MQTQIYLGVPGQHKTDLKKKQNSLTTQDSTINTLLSTSSELIKTAELWHTLKLIIKECNENNPNSITDKIQMFFKTFLAIKIKLEDYDKENDIDIFLNNITELLNELKNIEFEEETQQTQKIQQIQQIQQSHEKIQKNPNHENKVDLDDVQKMIFEAFNK